MQTGYGVRVEAGETFGMIAAVSGEVDISTAASLKKDLNEAVYSTLGDMVVDLSELEFIDSSGLGVLIGVLGRMHDQDRRLALVITARRIMRIFTVTGLDRAFAIGGSREAAWELIAESRLRRRPPPA